MTQQGTLSFKNREQLQNSKQAACYYCLKTCSADSITKWADNGLTAICPNCGVDSLVPDFGKDLPTKEQLVLWNKESFG